MKRTVEEIRTTLAEIMRGNPAINYQSNTYYGNDKEVCVSPSYLEKNFNGSYLDLVNLILHELGLDSFLRGELKREVFFNDYWSERDDSYIYANHRAFKPLMDYIERNPDNPYGFKITTNKDGKSCVSRGRSYKEFVDKLKNFINNGPEEEIERMTLNKFIGNVFDYKKAIQEEYIRREGRRLDYQVAFINEITTYLNTGRFFTKVFSKDLFENALYKKDMTDEDLRAELITQLIKGYDLVGLENYLILQEHTTRGNLDREDPFSVKTFLQDYFSCVSFDGTRLPYFMKSEKEDVFLVRGTDSYFYAVPDNMFDFKNDEYKDMEFLLRTCPEYNETAKFRNI